MTKRLEDFDFEATCRTLESVAGNSPPEAQDALALAAYALHFLHVTEQFNAFREYLHDVKEPATRELRIEREFDDMAQAMEWLSSPSSVEGTYVRVGGKAYEVWSDSTGKWRLVPAPSLEELKG
ncbi:MAG TPA: hypothetical protein VF815_11160 [Myxococcaceae bacterium]